MPSLRPATAERTGARGLRPLMATFDDNSGLRLTTELFLDLASPLLHIRHGLSNLRDERRRITALALNIIRLDRHQLGQRPPPQLAFLAEYCDFE